MRFLIVVLAGVLLLGCPSYLLADAPADDVNSKISSLEGMIIELQNQLTELKQQVSAQAQEKEELASKVKAIEAKPQKSFLEKFEEATKLNIGGEINLRYRENMDNNGGASPGFQLYEVELFLDSAVNKNASFFVELPIMHANKPDLGNTWVDFHSEGELAATGSTGIMVGHFMPWFGYYGYDDNQSWIYGGRTTTNTTLVRGTAMDQRILRDRQVGIGLNLKAGPWLFTPQVFNGDGPFIVAAGSDNDRRKDFVARLQYTLPEEFGVIGTGFWWAPKTDGAITNARGPNYGTTGNTHVRDAERYVVYFKYPDVMQATLPDLSLGGKPFMVYGEYHWGKFHANPGLGANTVYNDTSSYEGAWVETNVNIIRDKLVGVLRWDWFHPDADPSQNLDKIWGLTPAIKWQFLNQMYLTASYEMYEGADNAGGQDNDRITLEMATQF